MAYYVVHAETGRLLKKLRPKVCEACGHVHLNHSRNKWVSDINKAEAFQKRTDAEEVAKSIFESKSGPKRKPKVISI